MLDWTYIQVIEPGANAIKQWVVTSAPNTPDAPMLFIRLRYSDIATSNPATADFDNDGDLDLVLNVYRGAPLFFRNETGASRVAVRLHGGAGNPSGAGAKVTLLGGAVPIQAREMFCGGRYLSGGDPQLCFAAGKASPVMSLEVVWRSGAKSVLEGVKANRIYEIAEPAR